MVYTLCQLTNTMITKVTIVQPKDNNKKWHNVGIPVLAKIKTPSGVAGIAFEFHPDGTVGIDTMFVDNEASIDNWMKKGGSSTIVQPHGQTSLTGNSPLSISTIQDSLGIVKYGQIGGIWESQKENVRKQYEGTDQWMKAPNGKLTKLTEDQYDDHKSDYRSTLIAD